MAHAYRKLFDPDAQPTSGTRSSVLAGLGDLTDGWTHLFDDQAVLAVNIALATGRPVLVRGPSGSGKSSLARAVAARLGWSYTQAVVTSRTQARDLLWQVDQLRRLQDAQLGRLGGDEAQYVTPGPLFWAFSPQLAHDLLTRTGRQSQVPPGIRAEPRTVVLIDEIDKADPDVPNNLLEALGSLAFTVEELNLRVVASVAPLTVITTNEERDLPPAFLRRCVALRIAPPDAAKLAAIGRLHHPDLDAALIAGIAALIEERGNELGQPPSAAEYLDMIKACLGLGITSGSSDFRQVAQMTLWKEELAEAAP